MASTPETEPVADLDDQELPKGSRGVSWGTWVLAGVVLYALSPGPIQFLLDRLPDSAYDQAVVPIGVAYKPLDLLYDHYEAVAAFYDWYMNLFG